MSLGMLGRYRLIRKLAQGGMAEVFLAKSYGAHGFEKPVAIKRILSRFASDEQFVTMLIDEAKITSGLSHPNIVPVIDFNADKKDCYIVMEYVAGRSLSNLLRMLAQQDRQLSVEHLIHVIREAAVGLHHAHVKTDRNGQPLKIVHRDVSPQNILLSFDGYVKIIDFGIARARNRLARTEAGTLKGKLRYLAPEQVQGHEVDGRTDQFALGITLWESLTGKALFSGDSDVQVIDQVVAARVSDPRDHNPKIPDELARSVVKALSKERNQRYASCEAFAADLRGILARLNPDYDPASLGALMRKQFATEMEEDAREEAEAEGELARAGVVDAPAQLSPPSPGRMPQVVAPTQDVPAHLVENTAPATEADDEEASQDMPRTVANAPRVIGRKATAPATEKAPARPDPNSPAQVRRDRAQKGTRASEARRAAEAEQEKVSSPANAPVHDPAPPAEAKPGVDRTLTGTGSTEELAQKGVLVPVPSGVPVARPDEPTRAHFDARAEEHKKAERKKAPVPAAAKAPVARERPAPRGPGRSLTLLAMASAVGGAAVAVVLGLVVVGRLDATPVKTSPLVEDPPPHSDPPPRPPVTRPPPTQPDPVTTVSQPPRATMLSLNVTPTRARVVVDGRHVADWSRPFKVAPGSHRVVVTADGYDDEERTLELADGETRQVDLGLQKSAAPPPAVDPVKPPPEKHKDPVVVRRPEKKDPPKGQIKIVTPGTWASVAVDGRKQGDAPIIVDVPAGNHTVTLTRDGQLKTYQVTVEAGGMKTVRGEF